MRPLLYGSLAALVAELLQQAGILRLPHKEKGICLALAVLLIVLYAIVVALNMAGNWGSSAAAKNFRARESQYLANKQYKDLIMLEVEDFTSKQDSYGRENLGTKYSPEIAACAIYYQNLFGITL